MKKITNDMKKGLWYVLQEKENLDIYFTVGNSYRRDVNGVSYYAKSQEKPAFSFENKPEQYPFVLESLIIAYLNPKPISLCILNAKSRTVLPFGINFISPDLVATFINSTSRLSKLSSSNNSLSWPSKVPFLSNW